MNKLELMKTANEVRKGIVTAVHSAKAGHPGGSLSAADIFTYLYFEEMNIDPKEPKKADRDRFVLSKGHTAPGLYSVLAQRGYFPVEDLGNFCGSWYGDCRKTGQRRLQSLYTSWRRRDSGRTGMGSSDAGSAQKTG